LAAQFDAIAHRRDRWELKMQAFNLHVFTANVGDRILALVKAILEQNAIAAEVQPDSRLVDVGLTSMDMVNLMLSVEAEFDFTIPQDQITPENFQSVKTLEAMIAGQLQPRAAA
jgi:acyl carrier protein